MDLKIDSALLRRERQKRGWSQEQLATAAGLGIRTVQRIETSGTGSAESAKCLAAVFEMPLADIYVPDPQPHPRRRGRLWIAAIAACSALLAPLLLLSRANATDVAIALKIVSEVSGESRMNISVGSGRQTEIKIERDLRLLLTPKILKDGNIFLAAELFAWDGNEFKPTAQPRIMLRDGDETRLQLGLGNGRTVDIAIVSKAL